MDSVFLPPDARLTAYSSYSPLLTPDLLALVAGEGREVGLAELPQLGEKMLKGNISGRYVVDLQL